MEKARTKNSAVSPIFSYRCHTKVFFEQGISGAGQWVAIKRVEIHPDFDPVQEHFEPKVWMDTRTIPITFGRLSLEQCFVQ